MHKKSHIINDNTNKRFLFMFKNLFDLSFERDYEEALGFYFCYFIFVYFIAGIFNSIGDILLESNHFRLADITFLSIGFIPFILFISLSMAIIRKKNLKIRVKTDVICYLSCIVLITFLLPLFWGICFGFGFLGYDAGFRYGILGTFMELFFMNLWLGLIPVAILTTKKDYSLKPLIQKFEREQLEHDIEIERLLLIERAALRRMEALEKEVKD